MFSHKLLNDITLKIKYGVLQWQSIVRIRRNLSVNGPAVAKSQKMSVQPSHQGASGGVTAKKTERQFHLYLDHNNFNLCNTYSELIF